MSINRNLDWLTLVAFRNLLDLQRQGKAEVWDELRPFCEKASRQFLPSCSRSQKRPWNEILRINLPLIYIFLRTDVKRGPIIVHDRVIFTYISSQSKKIRWKYHGRKTSKIVKINIRHWISKINAMKRPEQKLKNFSAIGCLSQDIWYFLNFLGRRSWVRIPGPYTGWTLSR